MYSSPEVMTDDNPFAGSHYRVLVTGGTGFIGRRLVGLLLNAGHEVTVVSRDPSRSARLFHGEVQSVRGFDELGVNAVQEVLINLAGASIAGGRWSARHKETLYQSRLQTTRNLVAWSLRARHRPSVLINASAVGYYGARPAGELLTESSSAGDEFMADLCRRWEDEAKKIEEQGIRLVLLRFGLVLGHGGALPMMALPFRFFMGGPIGSGEQMISWIHIDDLMSIFAQAIRNPAMSGVYNAVAPQTVSQREFADRVGRTLARPHNLTTPAWAVRGIAGEMSRLFLTGQNAVPQKLQREQFGFRYPHLDNALGNLL